MFKDEIGEKRLGQGYNKRGAKRTFDNYQMGNEHESSNVNNYFDRKRDYDNGSNKNYNDNRDYGRTYSNEGRKGYNDIKERGYERRNNNERQYDREDNYNNKRGYDRNYRDNREYRNYRDNREERDTRNERNDRDYRDERDDEDNYYERDFNNGRSDDYYDSSYNRNQRRRENRREHYGDNFPRERWHQTDKYDKEDRRAYYYNKGDDMGFMKKDDYSPKKDEKKSTPNIKDDDMNHKREKGDGRTNIGGNVDQAHNITKDELNDQADKDMGIKGTTKSDKNEEKLSSSKECPLGYKKEGPWETTKEVAKDAKDLIVDGAEKVGGVAKEALHKTKDFFAKF